MYGSFPERIFFRLSNRILRTLAPERANKRAVRWVAARYDMNTEENEAFFARIYLHHIRKRIKEIFGNGSLNILDAGCGQGRLCIPLALDGHQLTAMDFTPETIEKAKKYASEKKAPVNFIVGDLEKDLNTFPFDTFHCIICTEVLYMVRNYEQVIKDLISLLAPGGLIFLSLRPRLFYVTLYLMSGRILEAYRIMTERKKYISGGSLNCLSKEEIHELMTETGIKVLSFSGIGVLSGIEGDPQALITLPSAIAEEDKDRLFEMELVMGDIFPEKGRYLLVTGLKPHEKEKI